MLNEDEFSLIKQQITQNSETNDPSEIRSLKDLIDRVSGKYIPPIEHEIDSGLADPVVFPFLAIVGQYEMKLGTYKWN